MSRAASNDPPEYACFATATPGLEPFLEREMEALGLRQITRHPGGVSFAADQKDAMRANLWLRTAGRILIRLAHARITHLAQLDKWARRLAWSDLLPAGAPFTVEASAKRSKLYHTGAIAQRIETAARAALGPEQTGVEPLKIFVRIEKDLCTVSLDSSGAPMHKRGHKTETAKAPLRETLAAAFLMACGFKGDEPVLDPMCGSGTFLLEAAEISRGLAPGRNRGFAFENFSGFCSSAWEALKQDAAGSTEADASRFYGFDRDAGAVSAARANAQRAGLADCAHFEQQPISELSRPEGPAGLVMINPPYGERIGDRKRLFALYNALGAALKERFVGWRVGLVTSDAGLAKETGLPFKRPGPPIPHGSLKIRLHQTDPLT